MWIKKWLRLFWFHYDNLHKLLLWGQKKKKSYSGRAKNLHFFTPSGKLRRLPLVLCGDLDRPGGLRGINSYLVRHFSFSNGEIFQMREKCDVDNNLEAALLPPESRKRPEMATLDFCFLFQIRDDLVLIPLITVCRVRVLSHDVPHCAPLFH